MVSGMVTGKLPIVRDIAERALSTFVVTAAGVWLASGVDLAHVLDLNIYKAAGIGGLTAVLSLAKSLVAQAIQGGGGSLDPKVKIKPVDSV